jgi:glutamyl/glutaminyl-tRNA synthetase
VFNPEKLDWFNNQHLARLAPDDLAARVAPWLRDAGLWKDEYAGAQRAWFERVLALLLPRVRRLPDFVEYGRAFFDENVQYEEAAVRKHLGSADLAGHVAALRNALSALEPFDEAAAESTLRATAQARGIGAGTLIHATRVAVTGKAVSPGLFEVLVLLGRGRTVARLEQLERFLAAAPSGSV